MTHGHKEEGKAQRHGKKAMKKDAGHQRDVYNCTCT